VLELVTHQTTAHHHHRCLLLLLLLAPPWSLAQHHCQWIHLQLQVLMTWHEASEQCCPCPCQHQLLLLPHLHQQQQHQQRLHHLLLPLLRCVWVCQDAPDHHHRLLLLLLLTCGAAAAFVVWASRAEACQKVP
jgi:hypothetical protein